MTPEQKLQEAGRAYREAADAYEAAEAAGEPVIVLANKVIKAQNAYNAARARIIAIGISRNGEPFQVVTAK